MALVAGSAMFLRDEATLQMIFDKLKQDLWEVVLDVLEEFVVQDLDGEASRLLFGTNVIADMQRKPRKNSLFEEKKMKKKVEKKNRGWRDKSQKPSITFRQTAHLIPSLFNVHWW